MIPVLAALSASAPAQTPSADGTWAQRCAGWIEKKGYSSDYIEHRLGRAPPSRDDWQDNISVTELRRGDVVLFKRPAGHVALVEDVQYNADRHPARLRVSEYNFAPGEDLVNVDCGVSRNFGIETRRWVSVHDAAGYWRAR